MLKSDKLGFFSNVEKKQLLDIITDFGDDIAASYFLNIILREENGILKETEQQKEYINKLINKKNTHNAYLSYLIDTKAYKTDLEECLAPVLYNFDDDFSIGDDLMERFEDLVLEDKDWKTIGFIYIFRALHESSCFSEKVQAFTEKVLMDPDWRTVDKYIFAESLGECKNQVLKEEVCGKILSLDDNEIVTCGSLISIALRKSSDEIRKQDWIIKILTHPSWGKISHSLVYHCLYECKIPSLQENFCKKVLTSEIYNEDNLHTIFNDVLLMSL